MTKARDNIYLVYDHECPACRNYCQYVRIKKAVGNLHLVDARKPSKLMDEITALGLDIDQGMVVKFQDKIYYASDAIHILSLLSTRQDWFNRLAYWIFRSKARSHLLYPLLKTMRNLLLWICGIQKIGNLNRVE